MDGGHSTARQDRLIVCALHASCAVTQHEMRSANRRPAMQVSTTRTDHSSTRARRSNDLLGLQRTIGNQAVQRMLRAWPRPRPLVIQREGERELAALVAVIGLQAYNYLTANWPQGRTSGDLLRLSYHAGWANGLVFANM